MKMDKRLKWSLVLTFPIWFYWFLGAILKAPIIFFINAIWFSYYGIFVYFPYIGITWLIVIAYLIFSEFKEKRGK
jgi:hypothetical protein